MPAISELYVGGTAVNPGGSNINPVALAQDMEQRISPEALEPTANPCSWRSQLLRRDEPRQALAHLRSESRK